MFAGLLAMTLLANPVLIRVDLQDVLQLPSGVEASPPRSLVIVLRAPPSWVEHGALTARAREFVLERLSGARSSAGAADGSRLVVKRLSSRVITEAQLPTDARDVSWYEVDPKGGLARRGPRFVEETVPPASKSPVDASLQGAGFKQGPALSAAPTALAFLSRHDGLVKLAATLTRGALGFDARGVGAGARSFRVDDTTRGVSLRDRARLACGEGTACTLWRFGRWTQGAEPTFDVVRVEAMSVARASRPELVGYLWVQAT
ncbi:MAG: hypothetical protein INH41_28725 [Myxococcaceae bacterium]|jgi:hypothetical protein|nr:hypothetical protein [Myxococcaceae bacterium]MCA3016387.1 hypothetical protein [Myxococcaceae bacterium]